MIHDCRKFKTDRLENAGRPDLSGQLSNIKEAPFHQVKDKAIKDKKDIFKFEMMIDDEPNPKEVTPDALPLELADDNPTHGFSKPDPPLNYFKKITQSNLLGNKRLRS